MACGLPVVTTDVGGNREVVCRDALGTVVPFGEPEALARALDGALGGDWDRALICRHGQDNAWDGRIATLVEALRGIHGGDVSDTAGAAVESGR